MNNLKNIFTIVFNQILHITPLILMCLVICFTSCRDGRIINENIFFQIIDENKLNINKQIPNIKVFMALDSECPLSQSYTKKINDLSEKYRNKVLFICFFPGEHHTNEEIEQFLDKYNLTIQTFIDTDLTTTKIFNASVVPEVFVLNNNYELVYQGLIDNWIGELGRTKQYVNQEYLIDAIESCLKDQYPLISHTKAIGCLIEK